MVVVAVGCYLVLEPFLTATTTIKTIRMMRSMRSVKPSENRLGI